MKGGASWLDAHDTRIAILAFGYENVLVYRMLHLFPRMELAFPASLDTSPLKEPSDEIDHRNNL
jgi:hypothetical protein